MIIENFLIAVLTGITGGLFAGILPGIGSSVTILLMWPILMSLDPMGIVVAFICMYSMTQFVGSVPAILLSLPGEISAMQAVTEAKTLRQQNQIPEAIAYTAIGSVIGSVICLALVMTFSDWLHNLFYIYRTPFQTFTMLSVVIMMVFVGGNRWWINLLLIIGGSILAMVGIHYYGDTHKEFATFGLSQLHNGLPVFPVLLSLFVLPVFLKLICDNPTNKLTVIPQFEFNWRFVYRFKRFLPSSFRGTVIGFIGGFCPALTSVFSAQAAYGIESTLKKGPEKSLDRVIAAETANNAGAFSAILPLVLLAIPISTSEALILSILQMKSFDLAYVDVVAMLEWGVIGLVITNIVGLAVAWPLARQLCYIFVIPPKILYFILFAALVGICYYVGFTRWQGDFYMWVMLILAPFGVLLRKVNTLPMIFMFILFHNALHALNVMRQLYF